MKMKKTLALCLALCLILSGCSFKKQNKKTQYTATFLDLFDTVTTVIGFADSEEAFKKTAQAVYDDLYDYHVLFDIYTSYEGINNLKTINDSAGVSEVKVDKKIIDFLTDSVNYYYETDRRVNILMGSVLSLWHEARTDGVNNPVNAYLPNETALGEASLHTDISSLVIDRENSTVFIKDPHASLDVGAIAKGWAAEKAAENAPSGLLISVGGNVVSTGPKDEKGTRWIIGVQDPSGDQYVHTVYLSKGSVVTSGDYQRGYVVGDEYFHHIIDPDTLYPARLWRSVTIICPSSGAADALSTALFLLPMEKGLTLLKKYGAEAMWIDADNRIFYSPGFESLIRT